MTDIDDEWNSYLTKQILPNHVNPVDNISEKVTSEIDSKSIPVCDDLYISTKTKVLFLNQEIDIDRIFWVCRNCGVPRSGRSA